MVRVSVQPDNDLLARAVPDSLGNERPVDDQVPSVPLCGFGEPGVQQRSRLVEPPCEGGIALIGRHRGYQQQHVFPFVTHPEETFLIEAAKRCLHRWCSAGRSPAGAS